MDAFYASVELLRYPQLKGLPVVIGGGRRREDNAMLASINGRGLHEISLDEFPRLKTYTGRGVITTATYAARAFGVGSAMGLMKAAKLCPDAILLPVDFDEYRKYSRAFKSVIAKHCPVIENRGVDEVYIDFSGIVGGQFGGGHALALQLQREIFEETGLTCSVGVAPNKLLAKMASEFNKPNGISIVYADDIQSKIWPLAVRKINGIGPKAGEKLTALGIKTIGQLAARNEATLIEHFGKSTGAWMSRAAWGLDESELVTESEPVSISRETTFERDLHVVRDKTELGAVFTKLCERLADDLQRKGYMGKTIGVKVKYDDFKTATRDHTIDLPIDDALSLRAAAGLALKRMPLEKRIRLLGVRVGSLVIKIES
jgi:DNA polymerase IV